MALLRRINQLFHADVHAILDQIEDPQALLKQSIREMEKAIEQDQIQWQTTDNQCLRSRRQLTQLEAELSKLDSELDLCLAANNDDLAKNLVKRKLQTESLVASIVEALAEQEKQLAELSARREEQRGALEALKQKAEVFCEPVTVDQCGADNALSITPEKIEIALLKEKQKRAQSNSEPVVEKSKGGAQ